MLLVDQVRKLEQQVMDRLKELEPLTREYDQLRKVAQRLGLKYTPGSAKSDDGAKPSATRRRTAKPAATRSARRPAKAKPAKARAKARAAKPAAKQRGARSTTASKSAPSAKASGASGTAAPARPRKRASGGQRSRGRRAAARPGQRNEDVLRLVGENPGITVREIGERLGVDATGLYRVVNRLSDEGRVRKDGTGLQPVDSAAAAKPKPKPAATADTGKPAPAASGTETPEATPSSESEPSPTVGAGAPSGDT